MMTHRKQETESSQETIYGIFKEEIKNRFLCLVRVNGEDTVCYIPSSCRLSNFMNLKGKTVLLKSVVSANARTKYAVYAVKIGRNFVLLNLSMANRIIEQQIQRRLFSFLGKRSFVSHEYFKEGYKADLFIHDTKTFVEVKGLLSCSKNALFPTVFSERAVMQLQKIDHLLDLGYNTSYIIISFNPTVHNVSINHADERFYEAFKKSVSKGMMYRAYSVRLNNYIPVIYKSIPMFIEP